MASAADLLADPELPEGAVPVSAVLIVAFLDHETGEEHLTFVRDDDASIWKHIGMLQVTLGDFMADCRESD